LINVQPEENCRIEIEGLWSSGALELWTSGALDLWSSGPLELCSEIFKVLNAKKKLAWTDLDKVSFKKFVKESNVEIKKSAWTDLDKVIKVSF
jgi:hypothetical protein